MFARRNMLLQIYCGSCFNMIYSQTAAAAGFNFQGERDLFRSLLLKSPCNWHRHDEQQHEPPSVLFLRSTGFRTELIRYLLFVVSCSVLVLILLGRVLLFMMEHNMNRTSSKRNIKLMKNANIFLVLLQFIFLLMFQWLSLCSFFLYIASSYYGMFPGCDNISDHDQVL